MSFVPLPFDGVRVLDALRRGPEAATPIHALCAVVDNAIDAGAHNISIEIVAAQPVNRNRRNNVREYRIIDDGAGMDEAALQNALALGAADTYYTQDTLSKFGLGLKSASFSQGETLEVLSSPGGTPFLKYRVSLPQIRAEKRYGTEELPLTEDDAALLARVLPGGHGTVVRITAVRKNNHPAIKNTVEELRDRVGIIYYYFMRDSELRITIDGSECTPLDPLFTSEAETNGNLNEHDWNGRETRWIQRPLEITLDGDRGVKATLEVTQLPHPPTFKFDGEGEQKRTRDKYRIEAGNYGFYVYRNKRLLSWAERFATMGLGRAVIPLNPDYLSFRGRLLLTDTADDAVNIDVKKSQIMLSDEAFKVLSDETMNFRRKSENAWQRASGLVKERENEDLIGFANTLANESETPDDLPGDPETDEALAEQKRREETIINEQEQRLSRLTAAVVRAATAAGVPAPDQQTVIKGEGAKKTDRIFRVDRIDDHVLYEPYYDATKAGCVRINETHRFAELIYQDNSKNAAVQILFDLLVLKMAEAETYTIRKLQKYDERHIKDILQTHRRSASEFLAQLCRDQQDKLPHDE